METITNAATSVTQTASKLIFGDKPAESGTEPVSGQTGKGTAEEPYDAGNKDDLTRKAASTGDTTTPSLTSNEPTSNANESASSIQSTGHKLEGEGKQGLANSGPDLTAKDKSTPAADFNAESSHQPTNKTEGTNQPLDAPTGKQEEAVANKKNEAEEILAKRDPNDHSGEPLKVHDGSDNNERRATLPGDGGESGEKKESKGTGEKWVKTSGLQADGGDFDATKPGAAREADRLLEEKGIHRDGDSQNSSSPAPGADSHSPAPKEKTSVTQKLKDKLHIGHKH